MITKNFFFLALCFCVAAHVWFGRCRCQRLETTHCLQERLLSQPSRHTVVLEGMSYNKDMPSPCCSLGQVCPAFDQRSKSVEMNRSVCSLMKELRVKTTLVIICLVLALPHSAKHTNTLPQQTAQNFYIYHKSQRGTNRLI